MKKTRADIFSIDSPYGIIIRLSDLNYSWFNRLYQEQYVSSIVKLGVNAFEFKHTLKNETSIDILKDFAKKNSKYGTSSDNFKEREHEFFRVWLYNDSTNPYNKQNEFDVRMKRYERLLFKVERIVE